MGDIMTDAEYMAALRALWGECRDDFDIINGAYSVWF